MLAGAAPIPNTKAAAAKNAVRPRCMVNPPRRVCKDLRRDVRTHTSLCEVTESSLGITDRCPRWEDSITATPNGGPGHTRDEHAGQPHQSTQEEHAFQSILTQIEASHPAGAKPSERRPRREQPSVATTHQPSLPAHSDAPMQQCPALPPRMRIVNRYGHRGSLAVQVPWSGALLAERGKRTESAGLGGR